MKRIAVMMLLAISVLSISEVKAQGYKKYLKEYLNTQWFLGVKFGSNLQQISITDRFTGLSAINYDATTLDKAYDNFSLPGVQAGIDITFYHKGISMGIQPNFRQIRFSYSNNLVWEGEGVNDRFETQYDQDERIDFIDVPVFIKYDITQTVIRPYVMGGAYFSFLTNAEKTVKVSETDFASGTAQTLEVAETTLGISDRYNSYDFGIMGGIGASSDFGNIRVVLEAAYRFGFPNMSDENTRFSDLQLAGIGDVNDDIKLRSLNFNLALLFPLRFISSEFNSN